MIDLSLHRVCGERIIMKKKEGFTGKILYNNAYAVRLAMEISKKRVLCSVIKRLFEYLLWVFYSAFLSGLFWMRSNRVSRYRRF